MPIDKVNTYICGTNGAAFVPSANLPVRLYTTGGASNDGVVVRCTGGQVDKVIGIAKQGVLTTGLPVAVLMSDGAPFQALVNTTVAQGDKLTLLNSSKFRVVATAASRFCARVTRARTNAGVTWAEFVPNGVV